MAKLFTGDRLKTIATREWVEEREPHSSDNAPDDSTPPSEIGTCTCESIDPETINRILKETGFPTQPLP